MRLKSSIITAALSACILFLSGLEGQEVKAFKPAPFSLTSPLVKKSHKHKHKPKLAYISSFAVDYWDTTMYGGFITFPITPFRSGFNFPPQNNIYFTIPRTGKYQISFNFELMTASPPGTGDVTISMLIDGQPFPNAVFTIAGDEVLGATFVPTRTMIRFLALNKGQKLSVFISTQSGSILSIAAPTPPIMGKSNRTLTIIQIN